MLGLSSAWTGVIHDTASTATLVALLCARERATGFSQQRDGMQNPIGHLVVYTSEEAHSSVAKAARLAGFGMDNLRVIDTDDRLAMRADALEAAIARDEKNGDRPCAIVATVGTTATTAVDPVATIAAIAAHHGAWLHVDTAMAGSAMILPECRHLWDGVEYADSLVLNPHKWLGTGFDLSTYYVRDPEHLIRVMGTNPSYLRTAEDGAVSNFRDWHIQLGRRFRALKLWFLIADQGVAGLQARLRRDLDNARWLAAQVAATQGWELAAPLTFQTVCVRHATADLERVAEEIAASGFAYLTPSVVRGRPLLRISIGAEPTTRADVEALWARLREATDRSAR
jgi:aromatic-L-amino-acid decarboxylase